ncbi:MAG: YdhR family protein [Dehalococcoidia bacterium]
MQVLIVEFGIVGMSSEELEAGATDLASAFAEIPGCIEKTWLTDPSSNTYGGVYKFRDRAALDAYLSSELFDGVKSNPAFTDVTARTFSVMERPTEITHGSPRAAAAP